MISKTHLQLGSHRYTKAVSKGMRPHQVQVSGVERQPIGTAADKVPTDPTTPLNNSSGGAMSLARVLR